MEINRFMQTGPTAQWRGFFLSMDFFEPEAMHNPYFYLASPLLSRSLVVELKPLTENEILSILSSALKDPLRGLGCLKLKADKPALLFLARSCEGDARRALSALEVGALTTPASKNGFINFTLEVASELIQKKPVVYDKDEDAHYDTASAFIKSMRGSDPNAAYRAIT